jgi:hypothetical protein
MDHKFDGVGLAVICLFEQLGAFPPVSLTSTEWLGIGWDGLGWDIWDRLGKMVFGKVPVRCGFGDMGWDAFEKGFGTRFVIFFSLFGIFPKRWLLWKVPKTWILGNALALDM